MSHNISHSIDDVTMNWDITLHKSLKFSNCHNSIQKQIRRSSKKNLSTSFCVCLVSWKQRNLEIRANILKSCHRPVVSLFYATKSYRVNRPLLFWISVGHAHLPLLSHSWQVVTWCKLIWPDLVFGFVHKRSGNEIRTAILKFSNVRESIQQSKRMDWLLFLHVCWVF